MTIDPERDAYRLYWINGFGTVDAMAEPIHAADDADAIRQAETLAEGDRVELWQRRRLVARIDAARALALTH